MREIIQTGNHSGLISSLPKWAANEIHRLDREVADLEAKLRQVNWDPQANEIAVPAMTRVCSLRSRRVHDLWAHFLPSGALEVAVMGLQIKPQASNRVIITHDDEWN